MIFLLNILSSGPQRLSSHPAKFYLVRFSELLERLLEEALVLLQECFGRQGEFSVICKLVVDLEQW